MLITFYYAKRIRICDKALTLIKNEKIYCEMCSIEHFHPNILITLPRFFKTSYLCPKIKMKNCENLIMKFNVWV